MVRKHDYDFFPDHAALKAAESRPSPGSNCPAYLGIVNVVDFVEYYELYVSNQIGAFVEHAAQNLGGHYETIGLRVDLDISGEDAHRRGSKCLLEVAIFLVRQRFDWRCIDSPRVM